MGLFEKVSFSWQGKEYVVQPDGMLRLIAQVEDVLTLTELSRYISAGDWPTAKLSQAFGIMLRHAGANVTDEDVYRVLFKSGEMHQNAMAAIHALQVLMIPPESLREKLAEVKDKAAGTRAASSRKRSSS